MIGNPCDLIKARMQADSEGRLGTVGHIKDVYRNGGIKGFWVGSSATVARAVSLGAIKMATYDEAKGKISTFLGTKPSNINVIVVGSVFSSYCTTLAVSPLDLVRTRMMTSNTRAGMAAVFIDVVKNEGFMSLYKGFYPLWARNCPYNVLQFIMWEQMCRQIHVSIT